MPAEEHRDDEERLAMKQPVDFRNTLVPGKLPEVRTKFGHFYNHA